MACGVADGSGNRPENEHEPVHTAAIMIPIGNRSPNTARPFRFRAADRLKLLVPHQGHTTGVSTYGQDPLTNSGAPSCQWMRRHRSRRLCPALKAALAGHLLRDR